MDEIDGYYFPFFQYFKLHLNEEKVCDILLDHNYYHHHLNQEDTEINPLFFCSAKPKKNYYYYPNNGNHHDGTCLEIMKIVMICHKEITMDIVTKQEKNQKDNIHSMIDHINLWKQQ